MYSQAPECKLSKTATEKALFSRPPSIDPLIDDALIRSYKDYSHTLMTVERYKELKCASGTFLAQIWNQTANPETSVFSQIASGFGLERTPYDTQKGTAINLLSDRRNREMVIDFMAQSLFYMEQLTHPSILETRLAMLKMGTKGRIPRNILLFDKFIEEQTGIAWDNIGWGTNERNRIDGVPDESTSVIKAHGTWSFVSPSSSNPLVANYLIGPPHPDLVSSLLLANLGLIGSLSYIPCDSQYSYNHPNGLRAQIECLKRTIEILDIHPLIQTHKFGDYILSNGESVRQHIYKEAHARIGVTLKPYPTPESLRRAKIFYDRYGIKNFRIFDPRDSPNALPTTIEAIKKEIGDSAFIMGGQCTGVQSANNCYNAGANAVSIGIGDGGHCKTASGSGLTANNPITGYRIQRDCSPELGVISEGGVGEKTTLTIALGFNAGIKHGSLIEGTLEQSPCFIGITDSTGKNYKLYSGEAAKRNKHRGGEIDSLGNPRNVEGIDSHVECFGNSYGTSVPEIYTQHFLTATAKQIAFVGANSLMQYSQWETPVVWSPTSEATIMAAPHY